MGHDGQQIGIKPLPEALAIARELDLDLVEVAAQANPPVCRVMDYGKYKYEAAQKAKESRRKTSNVVIKEMKYRPKIGGGDFDTKTRKVEGFLNDGHKVKVTLTFRGREVAHPELGRKILEQVEEAVKDVGRVEIFPRIDGRNMTMVLAPDKRAQAAKQKADAVAAAEEAGGATESPRSPRPFRSPRSSTSPRSPTPPPRSPRRTTPPARADGSPARRRENQMPKMKTHSGAKKRFKVTGTGKLRRLQINTKHGMEKRPSKRMRRLSGEVPVAPGDAARIKRMLGR